MNVNAKKNDPKNFSTSLSRSEYEGRGNDIFRMSRRFFWYIALEKRDGKNVVNVVVCVELLQGQMVRHRKCRRNREWFTDMSHRSASEEETQGKSVVF